MTKEIKQTTEQYSSEDLFINVVRELAKYARATELKTLKLHKRLDALEDNISKIFRYMNNLNTTMEGVIETCDGIYEIKKILNKNTQNQIIVDKPSPSKKIKDNDEKKVIIKTFSVVKILETYRQARGYTKPQLGEIIGVKPETFQVYMCGNRLPKKGEIRDIIDQWLKDHWEDIERTLLDYI